jgi:hypothetical protein
MTSVRIWQLIPAADGWWVHAGADDGDGAFGCPVIAWALVVDHKAASVQPVWWNAEAERTEVGAQGWPVSGPGASHSIAVAVAMARAEQDDDESTEVESL